MTFIEKLGKLYSDNKWKEEERIRKESKSIDKEVESLVKYLLKECEKAAKDGKSYCQLNLMDIYPEGVYYLYKSLQNVLNEYGIGCEVSSYVCDPYIKLSGWVK